MKKLARSYRLEIVTSAVVMLALFAQARAEPLPPVAKSIKAEETAILLVDFQANFVSPDGAWYGKFAEHYAKTRMLERTVDLVKKARAKGVLVVHITEGYTQDYRELDPANPGLFHRGQIGRGAWKIGSKEAEYYAPLKPGPEDRDLFLPPRSQASGFGGTGLNEILRSKGIKNVAVAGFTSDVCAYATVLSAYDLGFHVYALREGMVGFFDAMAEQMVNSVYPMWSQVVGHDEFDKMVEATPTAARKASAN
jgi:nicotinamidase-related amidase